MLSHGQSDMVLCKLGSVLQCLIDDVRGLPTKTPLDLFHICSRNCSGFEVPMIILRFLHVTPHFKFHGHRRLNKVCFIHFGVSGRAAGDINNDGLPDLYFASNQGGNHLYLNKGNFMFEDITASSGAAGKLQRRSASPGILPHVSG